jgi:hypothetical protein
MDAASEDGRDGMDVRAQAQGMEGGCAAKNEGGSMKDEMPDDSPIR